MSRIAEIGAALCLVLLLEGAVSQPEQGDVQVQFGSVGKIERYAKSSKQSQIEEHEDLRLEVEPGWKSGYYAEIPNQYSITEFIREGEEIDNWHELLTIQNFASKSWGSPEDAFNALKKIREQECPGLTKWNVLQKNETSILFESQSQACLGWSAHHELAKIVDGKYNRFWVAYTVKVYQMPPDKRSEWIDRLSQAEVRIRKASSSSTTFSVVAELERPPADERVVALIQC
jgi:hypothetical protein